MSADLNKIIKLLHPYEHKVLPFLKSCSTRTNIIKKTGLKDVEVMRALEWLENKKLITAQKTSARTVHLTSSGERYTREGLPERKIIRALKHPIDLPSLKKAAELTDEELSAGLGILRRLQAISMNKSDNGVVVEITSQGKALLAKKTEDELFLSQHFPLISASLDTADKQTVHQFIKRNIVEEHEDKDAAIQLTSLGEALLKKGLGNADVIGRLTSQMLAEGSWKSKQFRAYDVSVKVPSLTLGRKHIATQAVDYIKRIWMELGFKEMSGRMIETAFWDLDALFVPQDHPAREMQDTFYVAGKGDLPSIAKKIKAVHEHGQGTGSKGWGGSWSSQDAQQLLLRTHTTVLSAQTLATLKETDLPAKFFAVGKVFRNEALDWKHLFEFFQVEGIVVDPNANFQHLKGYLRDFYKKMGYTDVRIRPAHFPYTEPSCEVEVFHPIKKEWMELGGAGIFRPEVVIPLLGKDIPVLAWGLGLDRIISSYYGITDIRDLYNNDLKLLREAEAWVR